MDFTHLAEERYSCRLFSNKKVPDCLIEKIIEVANLSPTAVNKQPFKIFWMKSEKAKQVIRKVTRFTFGADTFLLVGFKNSEGWVRSFDAHNFAETDASIVATHMMLEITALGLATTWVGHFDAPLLQSLYPEMDGYVLTALFPIGYAADNAKPSPRHFERKSCEEIVNVL